MKNNNTPFAFLLSVLFVVALTGCGKDSVFNPFQDVEIEKTEPISNPHVLLSDCNCGEVLESGISTNSEGEPYANVKVENYCTGRIFGFNYCVDESNYEIPEVGSTYCDDDSWHIQQSQN